MTGVSRSETLPAVSSVTSVERMQLAILIAVLAALAQSEATSPIPVAGTLWRVVLAIAGVSLAPLVAALGSASAARALLLDHPRDQASYDRYLRFQRLAIGLWLCSCAFVLYVIEWPLLVRVNWALADGLLLDELCILAPVVLPLVLLWGAFYQVERAAQIAIARETDGALPNASVMRYVALQARLHLGLILLPALAVILVQDLFARYAPQAAIDGQAWWLSLPLLAGVYMFLPLALRMIWRTSPLPDGELRSRLEAVCAEQDCPLSNILVWHTEGHVANAAVAGMSRRLRYVFLTDGLLKRLSHDEIAAVVHHELGHIARWHLQLRMLLLTLPLALLLAVQQWFPLFAEAIPGQLTSMGISHALQTSLLLPLLVAGYAIVAVGRYSRLLEHDADLAVIWRAGLLDSSAGDDLLRALEKLIGSGRESRIAQWLHPSLAERQAFLARAIADDSYRLHFRRRLKRFAWLLVASFVISGVAIAAR